MTKDGSAPRAGSDAPKVPIMLHPRHPGHFTSTQSLIQEASGFFLN